MKVSLALLGCLSTAQAHFSGLSLVPPPLPGDDAEGLVSKRDDNVGNFEQPIDHNAPELGTFPQRYWWNATYWKGPGSPVIFYTPGEVAGDTYTGYLTERAITGVIAKEVGGAVVIVEHRNWGTSLPYAVQNTTALQQHTMANAVLDFVNFAKNVKLPFDTNSSSNAPQAPWVFTGGSYSGNLAAATAKLSPGTFWAYYASSAPVQIFDDFPNYYTTIQKAMPKNCSADLALIINHVDTVLTNGTKDDIYALKKQFGMQDVVHDDDFAVGLSVPLGSWQSMQPYTGYSEFSMMCDAIEGANGTAAPGPDGVGLPAALNNFAEWWIPNVVTGGCSDKNVSDWKDPSSVGCWDTYNATSPAYTDWSSTNPFGRTWSWLLCNEPLQGWTTAPKDGPTIVSRFGTAEYNRRQCGLFFPTEGQNTYGLNSGKTAADVNSKYDGWLFTNTTRMVWTNGELDPLLDATVSSEIRPGGPLQSSAGVQVYLIPGAHHATDLFMKNGDLNADIKTAITGVVSNLTTWVNEFYDAKKPAASGQA